MSYSREQINAVLKVMDNHHLETPQAIIRQLIAEKDALQACVNEWEEKTRWVCGAGAQPKELGMHRADVLKARIEALKSAQAAPQGVQPIGYIHPQNIDRLNRGEPVAVRKHGWGGEPGQLAVFAAHPSQQGLDADTLLRVIQRLNQNPYSLTKSECVSEVHAMRDAALAAQAKQGEPQKGDHVWHLDVDNEPDGVFYDPLIHKHRFEVGEIYATREQALDAAQAKQGGTRG